MEPRTVQHVPEKLSQLNFWPPQEGNRTGSLPAKRHHLNEVPAGVGRVVELGDPDISDGPRHESASVARFRGRVSVVASVGNQIPRLAVERCFHREAVVAKVAEIPDNNDAADDRRFLQVDLPPRFAGVLFYVGGPVTIGVGDEAVVGQPGRVGRQGAGAGNGLVRGQTWRIGSPPTQLTQDGLDRHG